MVRHRQSSSLLPIPPLFRSLAHARMMDYKPATAIVTTYQNNQHHRDKGKRMLISPEDIPDLLGKVASLIGIRAARRIERDLKSTRLNSSHHIISYAVVCLEI